MSERPDQPATLSAFFGGRHPEDLAQLSDEEFWRYARELSHSSPSPPPASEFLKCALDEGHCVLPLTALREVTVAPHYFAILPSSPPCMLGLAAWRGATIAVLDLAAYFSRAQIREQTRAQLRPGASLLVAQNDYVTIGLVAVITSSLPPLQAESIRSLEPSAANSARLASGIIGMYEDAFVLDIPSTLIAMAQHIKTAKTYA